MNIQNMMKQVKKMQQEMMKEKEEIEKKLFPGKYSFVNVEVNGKKEVVKINIDKDFKLEKDIEMLEDILLVAINDALKKVDIEIEEKLGKYGKGLQGLL
jgi:DNA-binding YbaB/EbfC family protein